MNKKELEPILYEIVKEDPKLVRDIKKELIQDGLKVDHYLLLSTLKKSRRINPVDEKLVYYSEKATCSRVKLWGVA